MKKLFLVLFSIIILLNCTIFASATTIQMLKTNVIYLKDLSTDELKRLAEEQKELKEKIHLEAELLRERGYDENSPSINLLKEQWKNANDKEQIYYENWYNKFFGNDSDWTKEMEEYPVATYVWRYMKGLGYSDAVAAGILGNMMLECGGGTLKLKWDIYNDTKTFYGVCQWSKTYHPDVYGVSLESQMNYLHDTIKEQIDKYGFAYGGNGFDYEDFLKLEDAGEAALCFARAYERPNEAHIPVRAYFAQNAYNYFVK